MIYAADNRLPESEEYMERCNEFCREIDVSTGKSMFRSLFSAGAAAAAAALVMYLAIPYVDIWAFLWK